MINKITLFLLLMLTTYVGFSQDWKAYPYIPSGSEISFPVDEGRHISEPTEWWYTTGHVTGNSTGSKYSYVVIYFYGPQLGFDGFRLLNVVNEDTGQKYFDSKPVNFSEMAEGELKIKASGTFLPKIEFFENQTDNNNEIVPFQYKLFSATSNTELDLMLNTVKRPLIVGGDGKFDQGSTSYTYYYSQTGIEVNGTLKLFDVSETVTGIGWIDRQYGGFDRTADERYEWFSLQLSNGMDINFWNVFNKDYEVPDDYKFKMLSAYKDENTQYFTKDFSLERTAYFCTPDEVNCYSKQWRLISQENNVDIVITANREDSEASLPIRFYEGSVTISGTVNGVSVTGLGFAELLHTYEAPEIEITYPVDGSYNTSENISWKVNNPDYGNPLYYDVAYSIDNQVSFTTIAEGVTDPFFKWENSPINQGAGIWFKIIGYSVDKTLTGTVISSMSSSVTLGVDEFEIKELVLYPNPVNSMIKIDFPGLASTVNYTISDVNGRTLLIDERINISELEIDIENLEAGLYLLKIRKDGNNMNFKFLVN